jgi:hypothetical protein
LAPAPYFSSHEAWYRRKRKVTKHVVDRWQDGISKRQRELEAEGNRADGRHAAIASMSVSYSVRDSS